MKILVLTAVAAAALCSALPAFAQASGLDRNIPEVPVQAPAQAAPAAVPQASDRAADRREQQGHRPGREANRPDPPRRDQAQDGRRDHDTTDRNAHDRRRADRRHWDHRTPDHRRSYGYVVPRPNIYYLPPPVYYSAPPVYYGPQPYYPPSGYNPAPILFQLGDYLPPEYRQQQFVVQDWEWRGLGPPPYGYHWILLGPDNVALVADATGQIVSLVAAR